MLLNMMGIEQIDEIVDISDRRPETTVDPKTRVTLTALFGEVLTSFLRAGLSSTPAVTSAPVIGHDFMTKPTTGAQTSRRNAA